MRNFNLSLTDTVLFPARLVKITRLDGAVLRIAEAETSVTVTEGASSQTYAPLPGSEISAVRHVLGGDVPSLEIRFTHSDGGTIDTQDLALGRWDGAAVVVYVVDRNNLTSVGDPLFTGTIQPITFDVLRSGSFDIRGVGASGESVIQTYQPMCRTDLFSTLCGLTAASFAKTCTVASIDSRFGITVSGMSSPPADGWFDQGIGVAGTSGTKFEIARWVNSSSRVTLYLPLCRLLIVGETLTLYPGCDKTIATCNAKFSNSINFQGEPHFLGVNAFGG
jgi:uncharacterized phage protein (TIGR02218 family)